MKGLALVALAGACGLGSGCSTPSQVARATPAAPIETTYLLPASDRAMLFIQRDGGFVSGCDHEILIDGNPVAALRPGDWVTLYLPPARYVVGIRLARPACVGGTELPLTLSSGMERRLRSAGGSNGQPTMLQAAN